MKNPLPTPASAASGGESQDGTALTNNNVTAEGLPSGYSIEAATSGSQTDVGESKNVVSSYTILDASWTDVTSDFEITTIDGSLSVTPLIITFDLYLPDEDWYDGEPTVLMSEWIYGYYDYESKEIPGTEISGEDAVYVEDEEEALVGVYREFHLKGGGEARIQCDVIIVESAGEYTMTPIVTFTGGSSGNYSITYVGDTTIFRKLG